MGGRRSGLFARDIVSDDNDDGDDGVNDLRVFPGNNQKRFYPASELCYTH